MKPLLNSFKDLQESIFAFVDRILTPNSKYTHKHSEQEIGKRRNKAILVLYLSLLAFFILDTLISHPAFSETILRIGNCCLGITALFLSCRFHPQIFKCWYSFLCLIYGPSAMHASPQGIYNAYLYAHGIPLFVHLFTGSFWHFAVQAGCQYLLLNYYYPKPLEEMIAFSPPSVVVKDLHYASIMTMGLQFTFIILVERFIEQAYHQALLFEQRKNQIEKQKVFLLGFSHELRNLINSLTGNVKLATLENITGRAKDFLSNAEVCGELLLHLVNNILDTGKAEIGELEINKTSVKTYDVFERIWGICAELIKRKDLKGTMKIPKDLPQTMVIDHHRLTQIFLNLIGNAIKFTDRGSIDITVEWMSNKAKVDEACFQPYPFHLIDDHDEGLFEKKQDFTMIGDSYFLLASTGRGVNKNQLRHPENNGSGVLKLTVRDTGCGMTKDQTDKLFQKFTQVTSDISKKKLGTGLGLFITKQLCERMDGSVRVYSQKNKGTYFVFCLPVETSQEGAHTTDSLETMKEFLASRTLRVMIVDDVLSNQMMLRSFFEKFNINVTDVAVNGMEAYHKYVKYLSRGEPLQIVTMDLDMPIMDGKEASQKIRELETERGLKPCFLLIISGNCVDSEIKECLNKDGKIRANAFLRKPIRMDDLMRIVVSSLVESET